MAPSRLHPAGSTSGGAEQRGSYTRWHLDRDEPIGREEVILAALVDNSKIAIPLSIIVGQDGVDLLRSSDASYPSLLGGLARPSLA